MVHQNLERPPEAFGLHLTLDGYGCSREALIDLRGIYQFLDATPAAIGMTRIMAPFVIAYHPPPGEPPEDWGVRGAVLIAESHITVHTYPDQGRLHLDIFSCKKFDVPQVTARVVDHFHPARIEPQLLHRGLEFPREGLPVAAPWRPDA
jgi:S-adenosylmethionine decarboxylase